MPAKKLPRVKDFRTALKKDEAQQDAFEAAVEKKLKAKSLPASSANFYSALTNLLYMFGEQGPTISQIEEMFDWLVKYTVEPNIVINVSQLFCALRKAKVVPDAVERTRVDRWCEEAESHFQAKTVAAKQALIRSLTEAGCKERSLSLIWTTLPVSLGAEPFRKLRKTNQKFPEWLSKAIIHCERVQAPFFWMRTFAVADTVDTIATQIYQPPNWNAPPALNDLAHCTALNGYVLGLQDRDQEACLTFLKMITLSQWQDLTAGYAPLTPAVATGLIDNALALRANVAENYLRSNVAATHENLGEWILNYRELVLELFTLGYPAKVIAEMYKQDLTHAEMLQLTWFRGIPGTKVDDVYVKLGQQHGFIFADPQHLAERHLYQHFQFNAVPKYLGDDPIKARNSFHPHGTTQANLTRMTDGLSVPENQEEHTYTPKSVTVPHHLKIAYTNTGKRPRVKTLYPDIKTQDDDFYFASRLERMKLVAAQFATPYANTLPEIAKRPAPRKDI